MGDNPGAAKGGIPRTRDYAAAVIASSGVGSAAAVDVPVWARRHSRNPMSAATRHVAPPTASPARAPAAAMTTPMTGPPIGVDPWKPTNHSAITRPRIAGAEFSWSVELQIAMNETLAAPARTSRTNAT